MIIMAWGIFLDNSLQPDNKILKYWSYKFLRHTRNLGLKTCCTTAIAKAVTSQIGDASVKNFYKKLSISTEHLQYSLLMNGNYNTEYIKLFTDFSIFSKNEFRTKLWKMLFAFILFYVKYEIRFLHYSGRSLINLWIIYPSIYYIQC